MKNRAFKILLFVLISVFFLHASPEKLRIRKIKIFGNSYTKREIILNYLLVKQGEMLNEEGLKRRLKRSKEILESTFYFYRVSTGYIYSRKEKNAVNIIVNIEEGELWRLWAGAIYIGIGKENIGGRDLSIGGEAGIRHFGLRFRKNWLFNTDFFAEGKGLFFDEKRNPFKSQRYKLLNKSFSFFVGRNLRPDTRIAIGFSSYSLDYKDSDISGNYSFEDEKRVNGIFYFEMDRRDNRLYPERGYYLKIEGEKEIGGNFSNLSFDTRAYIPLAKGLSVASMVKYGELWGNASFYELFNLYDDEYFRLSWFNKSIGEEMVKLNLELRKKLLPIGFFNSWIEGIVFGDLGGAFQRGKMGLSELGFAPGVGVRLHMPMPIFIDLSIEGSFGKYGGVFISFKQNY